MYSSLASMTEPFSLDDSGPARIIFYFLEKNSILEIVTTQKFSTVFKIVLIIFLEFLLKL